jgi:hypothetical protein
VKAASAASMDSDEMVHSCVGSVGGHKAMALLILLWLCTGIDWQLH